MESSKRKHSAGEDTSPAQTKKARANSGTVVIGLPVPSNSGSESVQSKPPSSKEHAEDAYLGTMNSNHCTGSSHGGLLLASNDIEDRNELARRVAELERRVAKLEKPLVQKQYKFLSDPQVTSGLLESLDTALKERDELRAKLDLAQHHIDQLAEDMERSDRMRQSAPDLDYTIHDQFLDLRAAVSAFVKCFCDDQISASTLPIHVRTDLSTIIVEALIWRRLCDEILSTPFRIWEDSDLPEVSIRRRQFWRTMTGQILNDGAKPRLSKLRNWQNMLVSHLEHLTMNQLKNDLASYVEVIVHNTIKLARNLAQSRTLLKIERKYPGADDIPFRKYDGKWMEIVELPLPPVLSPNLVSPRAPVTTKSIGSYEYIDFLVTPALVQLTNSVGDAFERPRVIVKAQVCFGTGRLHNHVPRTEEKEQDPPKTMSGRQSRAVDRLGMVVDATQLKEAIGDDDSDDNGEGCDSDSKDYSNEHGQGGSHRSEA
ncbi:hypothetical protein NUW58_g4054 [Xylaria curta]|uniref:Uncharacterized protein n=1 Tax=Xylaria curta TaxID=42375 RepID=A0ACC1P835_9PEZI|nr:hypothetical protein NUW58_g4054 [Xylaria curta]